MLCDISWFTCLLYLLRVDCCGLIVVCCVLFVVCCMLCVDNVLFFFVLMCVELLCVLRAV